MSCFMSIGILNNNNLDYFDDVILITFISISTSFITISLLTV